MLLPLLIAGLGFGLAIFLAAGFGVDLDIVESPLHGDRALDAPEGSAHIQLREYEVAGIHITEAVLGNADPEDELPMVVAFHGRGSEPSLPTGDHSDALPVRMIYPRAPQRFGEGYTWFPLSITSGRHKTLARHIRARADQIAEVLEVLLDERPTEGKPLLTGFSQGGMMTFALAALHPEVVDSAFPVCGWLPPQLVELVDPDAVHPPIRAMHAEGDPIVPVGGTEESVEALKALGLDVTFEIFPVNAHEMSGPMAARQRQMMIQRIRSRRGSRRSLG